LEKSNRLAQNLFVQGESTGLATLRRLGKEYEAEQIEALAQVFEQLRLFDIDVERVRRPSRGSTSHQLNADASNLAPFLYSLKEDWPETFEKLCDDVRFVLPAFEEFKFIELGGSERAVQIDLVEKHLSGSTPLARASFGTLRAIALFAMLHDPAPPRLTCLEEIDHGLHPHALDRLVDRLREASQKTQIILATHSPALVNRLSPNELVVIERDAESSATRVIPIDESAILSLKNETGYGLGELWFSGTLGGVL
jgi:predicted ATPase